MVNVNEKTGISFGIICSNYMEQDVVSDLLYGSQAKDLSYESALKEAGLDRNLEDGKETDSVVLEHYENQISEFSENYCQEEPIIEGIYGGVRYRTSWIGGALHFFIPESPWITEHARQCSPCVPYAGNLDTLDGSYQCYNVPSDWRTPESVTMKDKIESLSCLFQELGNKGIELPLLDYDTVYEILEELREAQDEK